MFRMNFLAVIAALLSATGLSQAACPQPPSQPTYYQCVGLCGPTCPSQGTLTQFRTCGEEYYYSTNKPQTYGSISLKYVVVGSGYAEVRWASHTEQDFQVLLTPIAGHDCPEEERN